MSIVENIRSQSAPGVLANHNRPLSADVQQGSILWLPPRTRILASYNKRGNHPGEPVVARCGMEAPKDDFYDHPILVISRPASEPDRIFFMLVSVLEVVGRAYTDCGSSRHSEVRHSRNASDGVMATIASGKSSWQ